MGFISTSMDYGLYWPAWLAAGGGFLFCMLAVYALALLAAGKRPTDRLRILQLPTLRGRMILALTFAATLPAISIALVLSERTAHTRLENVAIMLESQTSGVSKMSEFFIDQSVSGLADAANHLDATGTVDPAKLRRWLLGHHRNLRGTERLLLIDSTGNVIAASALVDGEPQPIPGPDMPLDDRTYFRQPLETGLPYVSGALIDAAFGDKPTLAIGLPVNTPAGETAGVLAGNLPLTAFNKIHSRLVFGNDTGTVIVDNAGQAVFAHGPIPLKILDAVGGHDMLTASTQIDQSRVFNFDTAVDDAISESFIAASAISEHGWRVFLYRPLAGIEAGLLPEYAVAFAWLFLSLAVSVCLALALANSISRPLQTLDSAVTNFTLIADRKAIAPPEDAPREVLAVFDHLGDVTTRLRASYSKLRNALKQGEKLRSELIYVVSNREKEIKARTKELEIANAALERANREDSLTGLANRRRLAEFLDQVWRTAMRDNNPVGILLIDIDQFKAYNDTYGHQVGDNCLKAVADAIKQMVTRASDLAARYGGEEFIVVLGNTSLEGALKVGENIRAAIENLAIPHVGSKVSEFVTVSIGTTSTVPTRSSQPDAHLVAADRALYNAKDSGRNKVAYSTASQTGIYQALCLQNTDSTRPS